MSNGSLGSLVTSITGHYLPTGFGGCVLNPLVKKLSKEGQETDSSEWNWRKLEWLPASWQASVRRSWTWPSQSLNSFTTQSSEYPARRRPEFGDQSAGGAVYLGLHRGGSIYMIIKVNKKLG